MLLVALSGDYAPEFVPLGEVRRLSRAVWTMRPAPHRQPLEPANGVA